ncbi:DNA repair protein rad10 [Meredithblackwellia eburnea MCA 4105]
MQQQQTATSSNATASTSNRNNTISIPNARPGLPIIQPQQAQQQSGPVHRSNQNSILVNTCQKGNPVMLHIKNTAWEYGDIIPDYQLGNTTGALYLQLKYHLLHPEYIHNRISKLSSSYTLRILLIHCDVDNHSAPLRELSKVAIINNLTVIVAWSAQEVARYLESYKALEKRDPGMIRERKEEDYLSRVTRVLTTVRGVNRTDVVTLVTGCGSLSTLTSTPLATLLDLPGVGEKKAKRLRDAFEGSFTVGGSSSGKRRKKGEAEKRGEQGVGELN